MSRSDHDLYNGRIYVQFLVRLTEEEFVFYYCILGKTVFMIYVRN